ncbi:biotin/acetyl-CoA-carboxylase ligase [Flexistipes sinusarabici DSM 4947]|uniref:Biotin/acetyl-CoA-carboxylase ligase n=1 Tax=Flexistipes sinusarabici (strain ATCC 49648 / DSM 4947 / MAS 10) TaxID=717231 RepID=F8E3K9_FLESM|nr:biotin--[acetyl-CoA-carboxylase] ligase [Flexistipes sinusarabici]AEI14282.1 biotin/acetyl-CoA-carboxylase ligase [Flexistipes sinusarabici DSM 4947]
MLNENELSILNTLEKEDWVSGEILAEHLKISRTAVWKYIKKFENLGYGIDSTRKKGYKLVKLSEMHPVVKILNNISSCYDKIICHKVTNSTQQEAIKHLFNEKENILVFADRQISGRGHENSEWLSPEGGIYFSVGFSPFRLFLSDLNKMVNIFKYAVKHAFNNYHINIDFLGNDILTTNRKIGGILEEQFSEGNRSKFIIIGVGIYLTNCSSTVESIYSLTGKSLDRWQILADILKISCENLKLVRGLFK